MPKSENARTAPVAAFQRAFDLGLVTTAMVCVSLIATFVADQFTTADLRVPLRVFDLACIAALLIWQFRRVERDARARRLQGAALAESKARAEAALAELEQSRMDLGLALGAGGLGVWHIATQLDAQDPIVQPAFLLSDFHADATAMAICGFHREEPLACDDFVHAIHPADRAHAIATLERIHHEGTHVYRDQYRVIRPDGDVRILDVRGSLTCERIDARRQHIAITGIAKDVTDEEALKESLLAKAEEARSAKDATSRFLAMMSHEVRTPMNGVMGMLDLVLDSRLDSEQRRMLVRCSQSAQALLTIVNDILDFSKIEAGKLELESTSLSLRSLIEDVCTDFSLQASRKGLVLDARVDPALPQFVLGDPVRLRQILGNLVNNAIKFTVAGQVCVRAQLCGRSQWALEVEDTGPGIAPDAIERLFRPFQQAEASTTRHYGGTGLGLSIIKQLADLMHGTVECRSVVGHGSCFRVVLPLQPWVPDVQHAQHVDITPAAQTPPLAPRNLLLAEDSPINREVILRQLAKLGHRCEFAEDGEQAWAMLRAPGAGYDALITDGDMPTLDGYALTERIRNWERRHVTARLPILAMTANALHGERERCLAAGMDAYVSKPVNLQQIEQALFELFMPYASVRQLCADDADAIRHVVSTFVSSIGQDVVSFEAAHRAGDVRQLRHLAHRMASGCLQLGEQAAQEALQQVEDAPDLQQMRDAYPAAESALQSALVRARAFLAHRAEEA